MPSDRIHSGPSISSEDGVVAGSFSSSQNTSCRRVCLACWSHCCTAAAGSVPRRYRSGRRKRSYRSGRGTKSSLFSASGRQPHSTERTFSWSSKHLKKRKKWV